MAKGFLILFAITGLAVVPCLAEPSSAESKDVIQRYLAASEAQGQSRAASMEISIDASIPRLQKEGKLHALRKISQLGKITYKFLGFQGDDTIKTEVIARYLEADQKGGDDGKFAITPQNYKFKFKGEHTLQNGQQIYVIFLTPKRKDVGLFKGEMWLDTETYLPVMESGKLVKSPSVFFKRVEFMRDFKIEKGVAIPQHMLSTIEARLIGKVNLTVNYTGYQPGSGETVDQTGTTTSSTHSMPSVVK